MNIVAISLAWKVDERTGEEDYILNRGGVETTVGCVEAHQLFGYPWMGIVYYPTIVTTFSSQSKEECRRYVMEMVNCAMIRGDI